MKAYYWLYCFGPIGSEIYIESTRQHSKREILDRFQDLNPKNPNQIIDKLIAWKFTKKGQDYWSKIYKKFNMAYHLDFHPIISKTIVKVEKNRGDFVFY